MQYCCRLKPVRDQGSQCKPGSTKLKTSKKTDCPCTFHLSYDEKVEKDDEVKNLEMRADKKIVAVLMAWNWHQQRKKREHRIML